ncbi:MAG TPA: hypothetical protein VFS44_02640 [Gemmatimonadaceae bacterium]|nr:hypothetical protein [Gemmatimonadaceae bacterium]
MTSPLLPLGAVAPDFTAEASDGRSYSMRAMLAHGPVALFFYPGNDTPG